MISTSAVLPVLSLVKWPATITGAILVFGLSTDGTLSLVSSNAHKLTKPVAARSDFNMPPIKQIADFDLTIVAPAPPPNDGETVDRQEAQTTAVALRQPDPITLSTPESIEPTNLRPGRIGDAAVNLRSGPSKSSAKLGTLAAGTKVRVGEANGGWVRVWYAGGEGWVYSSYLAGNANASIPVRNRNDEAAPSDARAVQVGSRMTVRASPDSDAPSVFKLTAGERVKILERRGKWLKVTTVSGDTGWIRAKG